MDIIILDDDGLAGDVCQWLSEANYHCQLIRDSASLISMLKQQSVDLVIQTCDLPRKDAFVALDWIHQQHSTPVPVIVVGRENDEECIVEALEHGADDYLATPLRKRELLARINALVRRIKYSTTQRQFKYFGPYTVDESSRTIQKDGIRVAMTQKEYALASYLFENIGSLVSRQSILENVWGHKSHINTRTVDTHISRIRKKLALVPEQGWHLSAVYQNGYRLEKTHAIPGAHGMDVAIPGKV